MKAVYYVGDLHMEMRDIPVPTPAEGEYLIKIDACGICGSDYEGFLGKTGRRIAPMIMGHECAGTIEKAPAGGSYAPQGGGYSPAAQSSYAPGPAAVSEFSELSDDDGELPF